MLHIFPSFANIVTHEKKQQIYFMSQFHFSTGTCITARVELYVYTINIPGNYNMGYSYVRVVRMFIIDHYIIIQLSSAM